MLEQVDELYENVIEKRKRGFLGKSFIFTGRTLGGGISSQLGAIAATIYAVSREASSLAYTQQIYPLTQLGLEYFAIIGSFSAAGNLVGHYVSRKILDFFS